jgi:hypothetical protein
MSLKSTSEVVFNWFVNLCTVGGFFAWFAINVSYLAFCTSHLTPLCVSPTADRFLRDRGMHVQSIDRKQVSLCPPGLSSTLSCFFEAGLLAPLAALARDLGHILDWTLHYHQWLRHLLEL